MNAKDKLAELERQTKLVSLQAARDARRNGSTAPRGVSRRVDADEAVDTTIAPPKPTDSLFYGLVGDVARAASEHTEVNPVAAAAGFLSFLGVMVGRDVYFAVGDTWHHPRLFTLHIGRSSRGGKGEALRLTQRIRRKIAQDHPDLLGQAHSGGLSSREGLAMLIHDGFSNGRETVEPIPDKRLWVIEGEFSNVLSQAKRDGNTLSAALRELWDGSPIKPATKASRVWASNPHVGMAAAITPCELHGLIHARDLSNGFANRFLMFWAERRREVPEPRPTPAPVVSGLAERTAAVIAFATGDYPKQQDSRAMLMSHEARELWTARYSALKRPQETELLSGLLERRAPYAVRLAMLFALADQSLVIEAWHLQAALAWVGYWTASVRYVFADQARETRAMERDSIAQTVMGFLKDRPAGVSMKELTNDCFGRRPPAVPLADVLVAMLADPAYGLEMIEAPRTDGRAGRPRKVYRIAQNSCGVSGVSGDRATARVSEDFQSSELGGVRSSLDKFLSKNELTPPNSATTKVPETRMAGLTPLTPQPKSNIPAPLEPDDNGAEPQIEIP